MSAVLPSHTVDIKELNNGIASDAETEPLKIYKMIYTRHLGMRAGEPDGSDTTVPSDQNNQCITTVEEEKSVLDYHLYDILFLQ
ncbi:MAG: hypothetical protein QM762_21655 [Chryseolinea sp.]